MAHVNVSVQMWLALAQRSASCDTVPHAPRCCSNQPRSSACPAAALLCTSHNRSREKWAAWQRQSHQTPSPEGPGAGTRCARGQGAGCGARLEHDDCKGHGEARGAAHEGRRPEQGEHPRVYPRPWAGRQEDARGPAASPVFIASAGSMRNMTARDHRKMRIVLSLVPYECPRIWCSVSSDSCGTPGTCSCT